MSWKLVEARGSSWKLVQAITEDCTSGVHGSFISSMEAAITMNGTSTTCCHGTFHFSYGIAPGHRMQDFTTLTKYFTTSTKSTEPAQVPVPSAQPGHLNHSNRRSRQTVQ